MASSTIIFKYNIAAASDVRQRPIFDYEYTQKLHVVIKD